MPAYDIPDFALPVNIYSGPWLTKVLRLSLDGNLSIGRRIYQSGFGADPGFGVHQLEACPGPILLLPAGTDIRTPAQADTYDIVEAPAGSGRWYKVRGVDDVGKGYANEFRFAILAKIYQTWDPVEYAGCFWPIPMP
jgi:hypothetical protein